MSSSQVPVAVAAALATIPALPGYVKTAVYTGPDERRALPRSACAGGDRRYPAHSKAAVYVSAVEYLNGRERLPAVEAGLDEAARLFGIEADVAAIPRREAKRASDDDYALTVDGARLFPCGSAAALVKSAGLLEATRTRTTHVMRREAARVLLKRAAELGVTLPGYVHQAAGVGPAVNGRVRRGLLARAALVREPHRGEYRKLAALLIGDNADVTPDLADIAGAVDFVDRMAGIHVKYARGLETPEELCYQGEAPVELTLKLGRGRAPVALVKAAGLDLDDLAPLGDDFVDAVRTPFAPFVGGPGIDYAKFAVAAENLGDHDSRTLAGIVSRKLGKA